MPSAPARSSRPRSMSGLRRWRNRPADPSPRSASSSSTVSPWVGSARPWRSPCSPSILPRTKRATRPGRFIWWMAGSHCSPDEPSRKRGEIRVDSSAFRCAPCGLRSRKLTTHVLILGAAGMVGRKLLDRLVRDGGVTGKPIDRLTLADVVSPQKPAGVSGTGESVTMDLSTPGEADKILASRPDVIFHLAAIVSGEAEADFDKGYRINLDGTRELIEAIRRVGDGYKPKVIYTSSIAGFGAPFPDAIPDEFHLTPLTCYGTQKAIGELLLADYTRRGFLDGVGLRFPTICVRPGKPNKAASGFFSSIIREPLAG